MPMNDYWLAMTTETRIQDIRREMANIRLTQSVRVDDQLVDLPPLCPADEPARDCRVAAVGDDRDSDCVVAGEVEGVEAQVENAIELLEVAVELRDVHRNHHPVTYGHVSWLALG